MPQRAHYPLFTLILISTTQGTLVDLSTLSALTWVVLIAAAALTGLAKTAIPGLASVAAALFALVLPAKESTGVMLALLLIGDAIALWAHRREVNTAVLRRLVPSVPAPVVLTCAWAGRLLAARIPLHVFEPLVIATTIVATVPLLV
jgi:integral membrane protein